jgi:hypothetical protein
MNGVSFSSHRTFIGGNLVRFYEKGISWNFHSLLNVDDIACKHHILMDLDKLTISFNRHSLSLIGH